MAGFIATPGSDRSVVSQLSTVRQVRIAHKNYNKYEAAITTSTFGLPDMCRIREEC